MSLWNGHAVRPPETGVSIGLLMASAFAPGTFAQSLSARSSTDQGLVTGLSTGMHYLLTVAAQDAIQAAAAELAAKRSTGSVRDGIRRDRAYTVGADLAVIPLGLALRYAMPSQPGEAMMRGLLRQAGWRLAVTGVGGTLFLGTRTVLERIDGKLGGRGWIEAFPVAVPLG